MKMRELLSRAIGNAEYIHVPALSKEQNDTAQEQQIISAIAELTRRAEGFSSNEDFWAKLLSLFEQTRIAAAERRWIPTQQLLTEATVLVNRAIASESLRGTRLILAFAPIGWFVVMYCFQALMHWLSREASWLYVITPDYFQYMWVGMVGGTTIVLWGIVKHGTDMTFDRAFVVWYLFKPLLGAIMGVGVVLFVQSGFFTLQGNLDIKNNTPLLVLSFLAGFSERFFIQVIDRVVTTILGADKTSTSSQAPPPKPALMKPTSTQASSLPVKPRKKTPDQHTE
jgi:hypothetical protein